MLKVIKQIQNVKPTGLLEKKLDNYKTLSGNFRSIDQKDQKLMSKIGDSPLAAILTLAATAAAPAITDAQCITNSYGSYYPEVDIDGDNQPDISFRNFFYSTFFGGGGSWQSNQVMQKRVYGVPNGAVNFIGDQWFPRNCYFNTCVFPYADGATAGAQSGTVGVLYESVNSNFVQQNYVTYCSTNTYTNTFTSSGGQMYTSMYTFQTCFTTITYQSSGTNYQNGHFVDGAISKLAVQKNGVFHFVELEVQGYGINILEIDNINAQACDPDGCLDTMVMVGNTPIPQPYYKAENLITTDDIVDGNDVELVAGNEIELLSNFEVTGNNDFTARIEACNVVSLKSIPSNITNFNAESEEDLIVLKFNVSSLLDKNTFIIERSIDRTHFRNVASIRNEQSEIIFKDKNVINNQRYFYRICQTNEVGEKVYSTVKSAKIDKVIKNDILSFSNKTINIHSSSFQNIVIELFNKNGETIIKKEFDHHKGLKSIRLNDISLNNDTYAKVSFGNETKYLAYTINN